MEVPAPHPEHLWLKQLVGDWTYEFSHEAEVYRGTQTNTAIGELFLTGRAEGSMGSSQITLGYDIAKGRFVGSWVGSMKDIQWLYEGSLNEAKTVLTLNSNGPAFDGNGTANYHDIIEIVSDDEHLLRSETQNPDGTWYEFMRMTYRRA